MMRWLPRVVVGWTLVVSAVEHGASSARRAYSVECRRLLAAEGLGWLVEPFACTRRVATSAYPLVVGTGLGDTGTRSMAAAVQLLGVATCHETREMVALLKASGPRNLTAFGARSAAFFDTPTAALLPRLACAYPNFRVVHTTRAGYHRDYDSQRADKCGPRAKERFRVVRCVESPRAASLFLFFVHRADGRGRRYGSACPTLAEARAAFAAAEAAVARLPPDRRLVMNMTAGFDLAALADFLGRAPPPNLTAVPHSPTFFCHQRGADPAKLDARLRRDAGIAPPR